MVMIDNLQKICNNLYQKLKNNEISKEDYKKFFDNLEIDNQFHNLKYRKDHRSLGEYALSIYHTILREKEIVDFWTNHLINNGYYKSIQITENVNTNAGALLVERATSDADFIFYGSKPKIHPPISGIYTPIPYNTEALLEVKFNPVCHKATYKISNLNSYVKQGCYVLTIFHEHGNPKYWCVLSPNTIECMLRTLPAKPYREMGGKLSIQLLRDEFDKFFNLVEF